MAGAVRRARSVGSESPIYTPRRLWAETREDVDVMTMHLGVGSCRFVELERRPTDAEPAGPVWRAIYDRGRRHPVRVQLDERVPAVRTITPAEVAVQFEPRVADEPTPGEAVVARSDDDT